MDNQYPKWLYHATHEPVMVENAEQHAALGDDWRETPDEALKAQLKPERKPKG